MIETIAVGTSALGVTLLTILYGRIRSVGSETKLKKYRSKDAGLADLLNYAAMVDDGIVVGKNGSFMAAWLYQGDDNTSSTDEQRETASFRINQALANMGNGWMVHVDAVRRPAPNYPDPGHSHFQDSVSRAMDEERRRLFEGLGTMYEGYFVLTLSYFPPLLAQSKFVELMFDDEAAAPDHKSRTRGLIEYFKRECAGVESRLSAAIKLTRLCGAKITNEDGSIVTHDGLLRWLQFCVTGLPHPVILPSNPMYLDAIIGGQELFAGVVPKVGRHFIQVVAIEGFPLESTPGILTALGELPCEYRWSSRFIFMDTHEAVKHLDKYRKKWKQKIRGFFDQVFNTNTGSIDQDAMSMVADAESAIAEVNSGLVAQGYYTSVVVLMDEDREKLALSARRVEKAINRLGFAARIETINTMDAYLGSLPGHGVENVRRPLINTMNLADLLPTSTIWTGADQAPCPMYPPHAPILMQCVTHGATPFRLNLHVRDIGHAFLFGPSGAGKSTHLAMLAAQMRRYQGMSLYVFDKGLSMYPLAKGTGGKHFTVGGDNDRLAFCPLQYLDSKSDRAWAMEWIDTILALNNIDTTPAQRNEIGNAVMSMHASGARTLSEFSVTIQDEHIREAINSELPGQIMGQVSQDIYDTATGNWKLIPQGARLIGRYSSDVAYGQARVLIAWQRIVFPDGKAMDIGSMPGADSAGYAGFTDQVNNHYLRVFSSAVLMSGVTAGIALSQPQTVGNNSRPTAGSAMSEALGQQLGQVTAQLIAKNMNTAPTLEIRPGYRFNVTATKDLTFSKPYQPFDY